MALLAAFAALTLAPSSLAGFFYHPKLISVVHLVTLGWITGSILGVVYLVLPMAFRCPLPARRADHWAFWAFAVGVAGMASHFWIDRPGGMVWSASLVVIGVTRVGWRTLAALARAPVPTEHVLPYVLAFVNILVAAGLGMLIGIDKSMPILGGYVLDHVAAHAHLAALGWATLMVMGSAYRLLPMLLPAAVPRGGRPLLATLICELGILAMTATLWIGSRWVIASGIVFGAGAALFLLQVVWMRRHPKPPSKQLPRPDFGLRHIAVSFLYLLVAMTLGAIYELSPHSPHRVALLTAYGTFGLLGFLAQMVVGVSVRLLPLYAWMRDFSAAGFDAIPESPHTRPATALHRLSFWCWTLATPLLAVALAPAHTPSIRVAGSLLLVAVGASLVQMILLLRPRFPGPAA